MTQTIKKVSFYPLLQNMALKPHSQIAMKVYSFKKYYFKKKIHKIKKGEFVRES